MLDHTCFNQHKITFLLLLGWVLYAPVQLQGQCAMACEDQVNVGLDAASCEATITYDMILKGQNDPLNCSPNDSTDFSIYLSETYGGPAIAGSPVVTRDDFGKLFYATVTHIPSSTTCTGSVIVDDETAPIITCPPDTTVDCGMPVDTASLGNVLYNTCLEVDIVVSEFSENLVMTCTGISERITRTFRVTSPNGKSSSCTQTIEVTRPDIVDLEFPVNLNGTAAPTIDCDSVDLTAAFTGLPSFNNTPIDLKYGLCGYSTTFRDRTLEDCGNTFSVIRSWTVVDPCTSTIERQDQLIVVADNQAPQIQCLDTIRVSTSSVNTCSASLLLPGATITDNCSANLAVAVQTPANDLSSNGGMINNLPEGYSQVTYLATDECGLVGTCQTIVEVTDGTAPQLTCEDQITVSLTEAGFASFGTESTVEEAVDNCCADVTLEIRRLDEVNYSNEVTVSCDDIGATLFVLTRATDCNDNDNVCMVQVTVEDNSATATIECPADIIISCTEDYTDPVVAGLPTIMGICPVSATQAIFIDETSELNACGIGDVVRTWSISTLPDASNNCVQNITIQDITPLQVTFPLDFTQNQCASLSDLEPANLSAPFDIPVLTGNDDCNDVDVDYVDLPLVAEPGSCMVLRRVWTVTETCIYDPGNPGSGGIYVDTQRIEINDTAPPVLNCQTTVISTANASCVANVLVPQPGISGECFLDELTVSASGDLGTNNFFFSGVSVGSYDMTLTVTDFCGNTSSCDLVVEVRDEAPPSPICVPQFTASIELGGTVTVTAAELDNGSVDACTPVANLSYRVGPEPPPGSTTPPADFPLLFDCDDVGSIASFALWVGDEAGNWAFCTTNLQVDDPDVNCLGGAPAAMVAGVVQSPAGALVDQVELYVAESGGMTPVVTGANGAFSFASLPLNRDYRIIPQRNTAYNESLTTFDLVKLIQHLTGQQLLADPYQQIAADVNGDARISILDAIVLQKLILNLQTTVADSPAWRFIPSDFDFLNQTDVFDNGFPEYMDIQNLEKDYMNADFMAIKVGDLNMSYHNSRQLPLENRAEALPVRVQDTLLEAGRTTTLTFELSPTDKLGFQLALAFDPELEVVAVEAPGFGTGMQYSEVRPGQLRISAIHPAAASVAERQLLQVTLRATHTLRLSESLRLAPELMPAELITDGGERVQPLSLHIEQPAIFTDFNAWLSPNPMEEVSWLHLQRTADTPLYYKIWTVGGQLLLAEKLPAGAGSTKIPIRREQLQGSGVYLLQVISQNHTKTLRLLNP